MTAQQTGDFSKGSIMRILLRLAIPLTLAQLINVLYNVVDRIYIGRLGGDSIDALTGVGVCLPMITIIIAFANLVGTGGAPLFSIERGKKHEEEAAAILGNSVVLLILFSVILTVAGLIFQKPLLLLLGASEVTLPYAQQYISIYLLGTVFVLLSLGLNNFINAQGFAKIGMCTVAIGAGLNIVLDPIFIFTFGLGVRGAAIATVISQFAGAMWTIRFLTGKRALIRIQKKYFRLKAARVKKMLALGLSGFTMAVTNSTVQMVCNATLQTHGGDIYVGIMTIINSVREIVTLPVTGFTNAGQPVLGYNYGAGEYERIKKTIRDMTVVVFLYTVGAWILISAVPQVFIRLFGGTGEVLTLGAHSMHLYFFGFCFMAFQFCGQTVFTGLGKPKRAIFFSIFRKVIIVVPLTLLLPRLFGIGVDGVFLAEPISNVIGGLACFITMMVTVYTRLGKKTV